MEKYQAVARLSPALSVIAAGTEHFVLLVADMLERLLFMVAFGNCRRSAAFLIRTATSFLAFVILAAKRVIGYCFGLYPERWF